MLRLMKYEYFFIASMAETSADLLLRLCRGDWEQMPDIILCDCRALALLTFHDVL